MASRGGAAARSRAQGVHQTAHQAVAAVAVAESMAASRVAYASQTLAERKREHQLAWRPRAWQQ